MMVIVNYIKSHLFEGVLMIHNSSPRKKSSQHQMLGELIEKYAAQVKLLTRHKVAAGKENRGNQTETSRARQKTWTKKQHKLLLTTLGRCKNNRTKIWATTTKMLVRIN